MKIAYVTPRYGAEVVGGAEHAARMLAERLVSQLDWDVEVLTTCALHSTTWENHYQPGELDLNGVRVRRFVTTEPRHRDFPLVSQRVLPNPRCVSVEEANFWINQQGPLSPGLLEAVAACEANIVVFYPYLYYPTVRGVGLVQGKSVMHPAAHDEQAIRLPVFQEVFAQTDAFVFQTAGERRLAESLFEIGHKPQLLLGLGVEAKESTATDVAKFRAEVGLGDRPFVFCLGRVDEGKGSRLLATYFAEYKRYRPGSLALVFSGPVIDQPVIDQFRSRDDIFVTGIIADEAKWAALSAMELLISPSPFEAFSLALVEAWAAEKPVLVNAICLATRGHVEISQGGLWFDSYLSFESTLDRLLNDHELAKSMAYRGFDYVENRFRWPSLIERYGNFLMNLTWG